jgi:hypothetical protein
MPRINKMTKIAVWDIASEKHWQQNRHQWKTLAPDGGSFAAMTKLTRPSVEK